MFYIGNIILHVTSWSHNTTLLYVMVREKKVNNKVPRIQRVHCGNLTFSKLILPDLHLIFTSNAVFWISKY